VFLKYPCSAKPFRASADDSIRSCCVTYEQYHGLFADERRKQVLYAGAFGNAPNIMAIQSHFWRPWADVEGIEERWLLVLCLSQIMSSQRILLNHARSNRKACFGKCEVRLCVLLIGAESHRGFSSSFSRRARAMMKNTVSFSKLHNQCEDGGREEESLDGRLYVRESKAIQHGQVQSGNVSSTAGESQIIDMYFFGHRRSHAIHSVGF
jgi:hypothetical protein